MKAILRILAVDDNRSIRESMPFVFPAPRYEVRTVSDGHRALTSLDAKANNYDVIIVDQKMPQMTGVELIKGIKERGITGKIVVLSAHLSPEICAAYDQMDVRVILAKPFDIHELRSAVDQLAA